MSLHFVNILPEYDWLAPDHNCAQIALLYFALLLLALNQFDRLVQHNIHELVVPFQFARNSTLAINAQVNS